MSTLNTIPHDAFNLECFAIKNGEAFIGYKLPNGNFHFVQIPYTEKDSKDKKSSLP